MALRSFASLLCLLAAAGSFGAAAFTTTVPTVLEKSSLRSTATTTTRSRLSAALSPGDALSEGARIVLVGPGFLQLCIAKAAKERGLRPMIVAPQKRLDVFARYVQDDALMLDSTIGLPEEGDEGWREVEAVVFCAEEAMFSPSLVQTVLDFDCYPPERKGPARVVVCTPIRQKINKEKSMGWMPIFNNDSKQDQIWESFLKAFQEHPLSKTAASTVMHFGSLFGGSTDGPDFLQTFGLDEAIYKMSLENYRDLKERAFDRFRLGAQVLPGDSVNVAPPNQEKMEKEALDDTSMEVFRAVGGYPEQDKTNRHTVAQAVVQTLLRPSRQVPSEFTILSKCWQEFPTDAEWDKLFASPGPASWPDPYKFDMSQYAVAEETTK